MKTINTIQSNHLCTLTHGKDCELHSHNNCEFVLFLTGSAKNTVDHVTSEVSAGDILFISHLSTHKICATSQPYQHRDIYISSESLKQICEEYFDENFYDYLIKTNNPVRIPIEVSQFKNISTRLQELETLYTLYPQSEKQSVIKSCIFSVIIQLLGVAYGNLHFNTNDTHSLNWLLDFITHIQKPEYFTKPIQDIIAMSNYSHSHFCALFRKQYKRTFKSYLNELRINYAISLLQSTKMSVLDIALACGYSNPSHFSQLFRKQTSVSPLHYRKS